MVQKKNIIIIGLIVFTILSGQTNVKQEGFSISPVIKSLLIPGTGEFSIGNAKRGRILLSTEIALLASAVGTSTLARYEQSASQAYAAATAGVETEGKTNQFWVDIGNYNSRDAHNAEHLYWREYEALYSTDPEWNWQWEKTSQRDKYEDMRLLSERLKLASNFIIGGIVINHIISAIDTQYLLKTAGIADISYQPSIDPQVGSVRHSFSIYF